MSKSSGRRTPSTRTMYRAIRHLCLKPLRQGVQASGADRYVKYYQSRDFALSLIWYFILGLHSLRELHVRLSEDRHLTELSSMRGISNSQLANLLRDRPVALWQALVTQLYAQIRPLGRRLPCPTWALDATFLTLGCRLWARQLGQELQPENAGVKLSTIIDLQTWAPRRTHVSCGSGHDAEHTDQLLPSDVVIAGILLIFDRGYRKYQFFRDLIARHADFITRACATDVFRPVASMLPDDAHPEIVADELGYLGGTRQQPIRVRRVVLRTHNDDEVVFLTSVLDLSAAEIAQLYARRWDIESFFRWLKGSVNLKRPLGYSLQAAEHTIMAALVVYLLALLLAEKTTNPQTGKVTVHITTALQRLRARFHDKPTAHDLHALGFY